MARAIRRCGELLKQVEASKGGQPTHKSTQEGTLLSIPTRESVAKDAGLSERQARELYERRLREYLARNC